MCQKADDLKGRNADKNDQFLKFSVQRKKWSALFEMQKSLDLINNRPPLVSTKGLPPLYIKTINTMLI